MGKKKGGLCQRDGKNAREIVEHFGSFLGYLIRSYRQATDKPFEQQKAYETGLLKLVTQKIESQLVQTKNEVSLLWLVYSLFDSPRMVDEDLLLAVIDHEKYLVEAGYVYLREGNVRGHQSSISLIALDNQMRETHKTAIVVKEVLPGSLAEAEKLAGDRKYIRPVPSLLPADDKKLAIQPMELDAKPDDDDFFMGGIPGIGDDEETRDFSAERKLNNRCPINVDLKDINEEFREMAEDDQGRVRGIFV